MDFSAFLEVDMSKEKKKVRLKTVDEDFEDEKPRLVRLHKDTQEELDDQPVVRVGQKRVPEARLEVATRNEMKIRSNDPDMGSLIEREIKPVEEDWETKKSTPKKVPLGWLVVLGGVFFGGIIWSLVEVGDSEKQTDELEFQAEKTLEVDAEEELAAERMVDTIEEVVRNFHDSRSIDELLKYVRHPERVRPLMEDYYSRHALKPSQIETTIDLKPLTIENYGAFWVMRSAFESREDSHVLIEVENDEVARVDWESFVCYQPIEWRVFVNERPEGYRGNFRVYAKRDSFYNYEFADSEKYASYRLSALNSDQPLNGYVPREGQLFKRIENLLDVSNYSNVPMILTLHIPENVVSKRGVLIEELVAPRWVYLESPEADAQ